MLAIVIGIRRATIIKIPAMTLVLIITSLETACAINKAEPNNYYNVCISYYFDQHHIMLIQ